MTLNKSFKEIHDVLTDGGLVIFIQKLLNNDIKYWYLNETSYVEEEEEPYAVLLYRIDTTQVEEVLFVSATETGTLTYTA